MSRAQKIFLYTGIPFNLFALILAVRILWEETALTIAEGPQMVGFSLAHGYFAILIFAPLLLVLWLVLAFIFLIVQIVKRRYPARAFLSCFCAAFVVLGLLLVPQSFLQWMFIGSFAKSLHAGDLLVYAASEGNVRTVRRYLDRGVSIESTNYEGSTPLFGAAAGGSLPVANLLVTCGANLNAINAYGDSPLEAASRNHHQEVVDYLKTRGARQIKGTAEQRQAASDAIVKRDIERMNQR